MFPILLFYIVGNAEVVFNGFSRSPLNDRAKTNPFGLELDDRLLEAFVIRCGEPSFFQLSLPEFLDFTYFSGLDHFSVAQWRPFLLFLGKGFQSQPTNKDALFFPWLLGI